ncbi:MAG TPA: hypothetical protein VJQ79_15540 [Acidimicrobiia bacterium]|nr:hypothetical protein [Acidimicrobiia bacterium]
MGDIHSVWGWVAVGVCGLAGLFGITLAAIHRPPGRVFQVALATAVGVVIVQVLLGLGSMNFEDKDPGNQHVFYGVVISFTLGFAYIYRAQFRKRPALYFGLLLLFLMGLGIRGIMTFGQSF